MLIDGWECKEFFADTSSYMREATWRDITATTDSSGLEITEEGNGYDGASSRHYVSANVIMWLMQAVR